MTILNKIKEDLLSERKKAGKNIAMISTILSEISNIGKNNGNRTTSDDEAISLIKRMVKNNKEIILLVNVQKGLSYVKENDYLSTFIPSEVSDDEILTFIGHHIDLIDNPTMKDMGFIMGHIKKKFNGNYNGKKVSGFVRKALL